MLSNEEINEELKRIGNTNLITNSLLPFDSQIFAIGDSHTIFYHNSLKIKEHWFYNSNLPITIYRLLNEDLDIYNIGNNLGNNHEKYNIKNNDYVIFYFGFNDIQKNIHLHAKNTWSNEINNLFTNYILKVVFFKVKYKIKPIISCIYPNPRPGAEGQNPNGSYEERKKYTLYANDLLKNLCYNNHLHFLDIYNIITDEYGFIKNEFTHDKIHLDYNNKNLREIIENKIYELCD